MVELKIKIVKGYNFMKKVKKVISICYCISSISFYIAAILNMINNQTSLGVIYVALGSTFLCLSTIYMNEKEKKNFKYNNK